MAESEAVDVDPSTVGFAVIKRSSNANFALVIFRGIQDSYPVGENVECRYAISSSLEATARDWVGLYRVGWRNQSDYLYYEWSPLPQPNDAKRSDCTNAIVFPASRLPKDDGEFYQFCYVTGAGHVRGASTPFQFKQRTGLGAGVGGEEGGELVEVEEDELGELLIIRTRTAVLEEQLKKASDTRDQLKQEIQIIENEKDLLRRSEAELQKRLARQKELSDLMETKMKEMKEMITDGTQQNDHLQDCINSLQEKIEVNNQERQSMEKRMDDNDRYIGSLQDKIKALVNEKDALTGRVKSLEEEKELYKTHFTASETTLQTYVQECERLRTQHIEQQMSETRVRKDVEHLETVVIEQHKRHEILLHASQTDKEELEYLHERLRNAEDKLSAAEHCKMMLNDEVLTLKQAYEKSSADLESARVSSDEQSAREGATVQRMSAELDALHGRVGALELQLSTKQQEAAELSADVERLKKDVEEKRVMELAEADGPLYALQMAQDTLRKRYAKLDKKNDELQKSLDQAMSRIRVLSSAEGDKQREISSLRDRLLMGQEAYKEKYIACERLETKLHRLQLSASQLSLAAAGVGGEQGARERALGAELECVSTKARRYKRLYQDDRIGSAARDAPAGLDAAAALDAADLQLDGPTLPSTLGKSVVARLNDFDQMTGSDVHSTMLDPPLKPLPAPIQPEKLHSPRIPDIKHIPDVGLNAVSEMLGDMMHSAFNQLPAASVAPVCSDTTAAATAPAADEDRFEDAPGEPQDMGKVCPVCSEAFPPNSMTLANFEAHVDGHYIECHGPICPICDRQFDDGTAQSAFEHHVQSHFGNE